jgi:hypothetical protein
VFARAYAAFWNWTFATLLAVASETLSLDHVAALAAGSEVPLRDRLIAVMSGRSETLEIHKPLRADEAVGTYRVRLKLWQEDLLPTMAGFPEFVAAIEAAGGADIAMAVHEERDRKRRFILLFDAELSSLLGAVELAVDTGRGNQPDDLSALPG